MKGAVQSNNEYTYLLIDSIEPNSDYFYMGAKESAKDVIVYDFYNNNEFLSTSNRYSETGQITTPEKCNAMYVSINSEDVSTFLIKRNKTATDYVEHQQTDYLLYIQQEMLSRDYFVKENDGWKEVHCYGEYAFDGTETYKKSDSYSDDNWLCAYVNGYIVSSNVIKYDGKMFATRFSKFGSYASITDDNCIRCSTQMHVRISTEFLTENTAEAYQALLAQWKSEGNPLKVFYELQTPTKLPCTEEQSAVLDELNNLNLFDGVNNIITAENIALLQAIYTANAQKYVDKEISDIKEQLNTINELLSTAGTSSLLLDNLQTDLESEVM